MKALILQLLNLTDRPVRLRLGILGILCTITTLLDSIGIFLVFSLFKIIIEPAAVDQIGWLKNFRDLINPADLSSFIVLLCVALLALFLVKGLLQLVVNWMRLRIEWIVRAEVATTLLDRYLRNPYGFHLKHNSNELVRNVHNCSSQVSTGVLSILDLFSDSMLLIFIGAVLIFVEPAITVTAFAVVGTLGVFYLGLGKPYFKAWGHGVNNANENMYRAVLEPLSGVKQIKTLGAEPFFIECFRHHADLYGVTNLRNAFAYQAMKPVLEMLLVSALLIPVTILATSGGRLDSVIPTLIMFGTSAYRLLPSAIRITTTWQGLRFSQPGIEIVYRDLRDRRTEESPTATPVVPRPNRLKHKIELKNVSFGYEGTQTRVLDDVSLVIRRGQSVGLVGASGAGKTTLADILLGLLDPTAGAVIIDDNLVSPNTGVQPKLFGYVSQDSFLIDDTAKQNVTLGSHSTDGIDDARLQLALDAASLSVLFQDRADGLNAVLGDRGIRLSGGQRQRLTIARALYQDPDILVFDEATSSLDSVTETEIAEAVQRLRGDKTLIIIAHRLSTVQDCDILFYMEQGRLIDSGSFNSLIERNPHFRIMVEKMKITEEVYSEISNEGALPRSSDDTSVGAKS
jgi:ABC-type multidrug transport system fused ATPase/permease subunit